jgi:hypothetical protein
MCSLWIELILAPLKLRGIIGSTVFREHDAPGYRLGIWTTVIANELVVVITLALCQIPFC